mmetsp:Transcript_4001/g.5832  ORF Transcript_4001/g.5832 Transcript_4001/m.5832 type:complete len:81 (-) Transcript_4001:197-439(-)
MQTPLPIISQGHNYQHHVQPPPTANTVTSKQSPIMHNRYPLQRTSPKIKTTVQAVRTKDNIISLINQAQPLPSAKELAYA